MKKGLGKKENKTCETLRNKSDKETRDLDVFLEGGSR